MTEAEEPGSRPEPTSDSLVGALLERLQASAGTVSATLSLALAEARLAATSAGLLLLVALLLVATLLIVWLLCAALLAVALHAAGTSISGVLLILLLLHLALCAGLAWAGNRLSRHLAFSHTREALAYQRELSDTVRDAV